MLDDKGDGASASSGLGSMATVRTSAVPLKRPPGFVLKAYAGCQRQFHISAPRHAVQRTTRPSGVPPRARLAHKPPPPPPPPPRPGEKRPLSELFAERRFPFVGLALSAGVLGAYVAYLAVVFLREPPPCANPAHAHGGAGSAFVEPIAPAGLPTTFTRSTAAQFDTSLDMPEWLMGITKYRRRLAAQARGHVLEVAVGTGRNMSFYDWDDVADMDPTRRRLRQLEKTRYRPSASPLDAVSPEVTSFTGVDISADALAIARSKVRKAVPGVQGLIGRRPPKAEGDVVVDLYGSRLRLIRGDVQERLPPPPPHVSSRPAGSRSLGDEAAAAAAAAAPSATKYDTIIQTFGLCSVTDPTALLANLCTALQPGTGRILLLEHGHGSWNAVNRMLDRYAGRHFERFGCWWNRDIEGIVRAAAAAVPGLEVMRIDRPGWFQAGTTLWIELRLKGDPDRETTSLTGRQAWLSKVE